MVILPKVTVWRHALLGTSLKEHTTRRSPREVARVGDSAGVEVGAGRLESVMGLDWMRGYEREMFCNID